MKKLFEAGRPRHPNAGRKKGVTNKVTADIKEMLREALEEAHENGGKAYLIQQSKDNPTAFMSLIGKIIPSDINQKLSGMVEVNGKLEFVSPKRD